MWLPLPKHGAKNVTYGQRSKNFWLFSSKMNQMATRSEAMQV
jgi:hypothetical protein